MRCDMQLPPISSAQKRGLHTASTRRTLASSTKNKKWYTKEFETDTAATKVVTRFRIMDKSYTWQL